MLQAARRLARERFTSHLPAASACLFNYEIIFLPEVSDLVLPADHVRSLKDVGDTGDTILNKEIKL